MPKTPQEVDQMGGCDYPRTLPLHGVNTAVETKILNDSWVQSGSCFPYLFFSMDVHDRFHYTGFSWAIATLAVGEQSWLP